MITREEILKIAALSKLYVQEDELDVLTRDMNRIVAFANTIQQALGEEEQFDQIAALSNVYREDEVLPSYDRERILKNVDGGENGYFPVKKRK